MPIGEYTSAIDVTDKWGRCVKGGQAYLTGLFLERDSGSDTKYRLVKKDVFFYKESVIYPFIQMEATKKGFTLAREEQLQITRFIE